MSRPQTSASPQPPGDYAAERDRLAAVSRSKSAKGRDVGAIPPIADVDRRERCRTSLRLFCTTYNPGAFSLDWGEAQIRAVERIEECVRQGALYAFAMPRGSGKTTLCRMAALWAVVYRYRRYAFLIGANKDKAHEAVEALQTYLRFLPELAADFPEISWPFEALDGIANRASGQTCGGEPTMIRIGKARIILPTVPPPANWPKHWPLRHDGRVPTSGAIIGASGLSGQGLRGSVMTLTTGESVRPDLVVLDDPQTDQSARSRLQNETRIRLVSGAVLGMAGPGQTISAVMPCTVIEPGDMVDTILDRDQHPLWRGERTALLSSMPTHLDAWDPYFDLYRQGAQQEPPDLRAANEYYRARQDVLDAGAVASWPARKLPDEISAIQHAMNLYCRDSRAFFAEYQNDPRAKSAEETKELQAAALVQKLSRVPRGQIGPEASILTAFIDCSSRLLWYAVVAWDSHFGGHVVEYGSWPEQTRAYYTQHDARPALMDHYPNLNEEATLYAGLRDLTGTLLPRRFSRVDGGEAGVIELCLIDAGWSTDTVYRFTRQSAHGPALLPSKGVAATNVARSVDELERKPGERAGPGWRLGIESAGRGRRVMFDADQWKTFVADRFLMPPGSPGGLMLPGSDPFSVRLMADHLAAEFAVPKRARGRTWLKWSIRPERPDNHLFDCVVGAAVAASVRGLVWSAATAAGDGPRSGSGRKKVNIETMFEKRRI